MPYTPGLYCFVRPVDFLNAPLDPVYFGDASADLRSEAADNDLRIAAIKLGAVQLGYLEIAGRIARKRILSDLLQAHDCELNGAFVPGANIVNSRFSRNAATG